MVVRKSKTTATIHFECMDFLFYPLIFSGLWHLQTWMTWAADHMQYSPFYSHRLEHNINIIYCALCWFEFWEKQKGKNHVTFLTSLRCGSFISSWFFFVFFLGEVLHWHAEWNRQQDSSCWLGRKVSCIILPVLKEECYFFYQSQPVKAF